MRPQILLDTDIGNDIDDALALLHALADRDECDLLAITSCKPNPLAAEYVARLNRFYGRDELPIGLLDAGPKPADGPYLRATLDAIDPNHGDAPRDWPTGVRIMRETLAAAAPRSVTLVAIGFATNLARLLESPPDDVSPLDGVSLVRDRVASLVWMAGHFGADAGEQPEGEWNVLMDVESARAVCRRWPTPITFSGWEVGGRIHFPACAIDERFTWATLHPVAEAYRRCKPMPYDRPTWDLTAVLHAVRPCDTRLLPSEPGLVNVRDTAHTDFTLHAEGPHCYLRVRLADHASLRDDMVDLCASPRRAVKQSQGDNAREVQAEVIL